MVGDSLSAQLYEETGTKFLIAASGSSVGPSLSSITASSPPIPNVIELSSRGGRRDDPRGYDRPRVFDPLPREGPENGARYAMVNADGVRWSGRGETIND